MGRASKEITPDDRLRAQRYWEFEEPQIFETGRNAIRYWKNAGKIQIATPDYVTIEKTTYGPREVKKPGKLSALDLEALEEDQETLAWLLDILTPLKAEA